MAITPQRLQAIQTDAQLLEFLHAELGWQLEGEPGVDFYEEPELVQDLKGAKARVRSVVPESIEDEWLILLVEFDERYYRRDLRSLLSAVRRHQRLTNRFEGRSKTLFMVTMPKPKGLGPGYGDIQFVRFTEAKKGTPELRSFGWRYTFAGRTVCETNLKALYWTEKSHWEDAWSVEALTERFYDEFERVFYAFKSQITSIETDAERKQAYCQLWFNRLLLLAFVERRGWLVTPEGRTDYLRALWQRHKAIGSYTDLGVAPNRIPNSFAGLLGRVFTYLDADTESRTMLWDDSKILGTVPYLNGGLFHVDEVERHGYQVPDSAFEEILGDDGLFVRFNFTVTESSPLDQVVAIDPEMLGRVFERLVNDRHQEGKYYTPRTVVSFMVDESIKAYLVEKGLSPEKADLLVDQESIRDLDTGVHFDGDELGVVRTWLSTVRAVDPACGSGAYLLGLLQKLFTLCYVLEWRSLVKSLTPVERGRFLYRQKLQLVQKSIYGVDLDPTAVSIARLRMWLSLAVENVEGERPRPLPYLDFKVAQGDSLMFPVTANLQGTAESELFHSFVAARNDAESTDELLTDAFRSKRRDEAIELRNDIQTFANIYADSAFPWPIAFEEVFRVLPPDETVTLQNRPNLWVEGGKHGQDELFESIPSRLPGFDIVVANPPYVNSGELLRSLGQAKKTSLIKAYPETGSGTADLLVFFFERAVHLLRPGGQLAFITSNKWLKSGYGGKLRSFMAKSMKVRALLDYNDNEVFKRVIAYPLVTLAQKNPALATEARYCSVPRFGTSEAIPAPVLLLQEGHVLSPDALRPDGNWRLEAEGDGRLAQMRDRGIPLGEYVKGKIYYGIKTGLNEVKIGSDGKMYGKIVPNGVRVVDKEGVFVIDGKKRAQLIAEDVRSEEIIKPLAVGRDIRRWRIEDNDRWLIVTKIGTDMTRYPAVMNHLQKYETLLRPRADQGDHWWELRACAYYHEFDKQKIVYPVMTTETRFCLAESGVMVNDKAFIFTCDDLWMLAILNSSPIWEQLIGMCSALQGNTYELRRQEVQRLLLPASLLSETDSETDRMVLSGLSSTIIQLKSQDANADVSSLEREINRRVEVLFGLEPKPTL